MYGHILLKGMHTFEMLSVAQSLHAKYDLGKIVKGKKRMPTSIGCDFGINGSCNNSSTES